MTIHNKWRRIAGFALLAPLLWLMPSMVHASDYLAVETSSYALNDGDVAAGPSIAATQSANISRYSATTTTITTAAITTTNAEIAQPSAAIATYGPFRVVSPQRAEILGDIEPGAPQLFAKLLAAYPAMRQIDFIDCPGTTDDAANLKVARMIRKAGIATHVPAGGFVGSGGVELFLAGIQRSAAPSAEFAVHSWMDEDGMQADDFAMSDPVHQAYLTYYREIGMSRGNALAFYQLTNSAPFEDALYLKSSDIAAYIPVN